MAGLRISRRRYDRRRAARFKKGYARWIPYLAAWDATLRLIASEARIRRRFRPGFVLDDELVGLTATTASGGAVIYVHPDRFAQVAKAHRERPLAIAAFLHGLAVHELTHLDGRMGEGHSESYTAAREDLGAATGHLLPAIAALVSRLLKLPSRPTEDEKQIRRLTRSLERARVKGMGLAKARARVDELQRELDELRGGGERKAPSDEDLEPVADPAEAVLVRAVAALRARPPIGVEPAYIERFVNRHRV